MVAKLASSKLPASFGGASAVKAYLADHWGLGPGRTASVLLHLVAAAPQKRLGSDDDARGFIDQTVQDYGKDAGVSLSYVSSADGTSQVVVEGVAFVQAEGVPPPFEIVAVTREKRPNPELLPLHTSISFRAHTRMHPRAQIEPIVMPAVTVEMTSAEVAEVVAVDCGEARRNHENH